MLSTCPQILVAYPRLPADSLSLFSALLSACETDIQRSFSGEIHFFFPGTASQTKQTGPHTWLHISPSPGDSVILHLRAVAPASPTVWFQDGYVFACPLQAMVTKSGIGLYLIETEAGESLEKIGVHMGTAAFLLSGQSSLPFFPIPGRWVATEADWSALPPAFLQAAQPCVFLDRDGVVIEDVEYPFRLTDFHPNLDLIPLLQVLQTKGWRRVILTNQSGLARGFFTETDYEAFTQHLLAFFQDKGVTFDGIFHCPYHPSGTVSRFTRESVLRKPKPGMMLQACKQFPIDLVSSFMVGDRGSDAIALWGVQTLFLQGRYPLEGLSPVFVTARELLQFF